MDCAMPSTRGENNRIHRTESRLKADKGPFPGGYFRSMNPKEIDDKPSSPTLVGRNLYGAMNLLEELQASVVCGDGAMGTELMGAGVPMEVCFEEVNTTNPDVVLHIHEAYIAAGSRVIETNTFGANSMRLAKHGLESKVRELNTAAVAVAKRAATGKDICVAGSVGPLGVPTRNSELRRSIKRLFSKSKSAPSWRQMFTPFFSRRF